MRSRLFAVVALMLAFGPGCDSDGGPAADVTSGPTATEVVSPTPDPGESLEAFVGVDLAKAVKRLESKGYEVDLSDLPRGARIYATGLATHPMVVVKELNLRGNTVFVLRVRCPKERPC